MNTVSERARGASEAGSNWFIKSDERVVPLKCQSTEVISQELTGTLSVGAAPVKNVC